MYILISGKFTALSIFSKMYYFTIRSSFLTFNRVLEILIYCFNRVLISKCKVKKISVWAYLLAKMDIPKSTPRDLDPLELLWYSDSLW